MQPVTEVVCQICFLPVLGICYFLTPSLNVLYQILKYFVHLFPLVSETSLKKSSSLSLPLAVGLICLKNIFSPV